MAVVAARQGSTTAFRRRTLMRPRRTLSAALRAPFFALIAGLLAACPLGVALTTPASAQSFTYNPVPQRPKPPRTAR